MQGWLSGLFRLGVLLPSVASVEELQELLADVSTLGQRDLTAVWRQAEGLDSQALRQYFMSATPDIVEQYATVSGLASAEFYDAQLPDSPFRAVPAAPPPLAQVEGSTSWALSALYRDTLTSPLTLFSGSLQRMIFQTSRETIVGSVRMEPGATYARYASANACSFCRMLATRGAVYSTKGSAGLVGADRWEIKRNGKGQKVGGSIGRTASARGNEKTGQKSGDKFHDNCRCMAVCVRPGQSYEPPDYVNKWEQDYIAAVKATPGTGEYGAIDTKAVLNHMRSNN